MEGWVLALMLLGAAGLAGLLVLRYDPVDWVEGTLVWGLTTIALAVPIILYALVADNREWAQYVMEHHCEPTGVTRRREYLQPMIAGKVTVLMPMTTVDTQYRCADGEVRWR